jgi:hypothetical protein
MTNRRSFALASVGLGVVGLWLPGGFREATVAVSAMLLPVLLCWGALHTVRHFGGAGSLGAAIVMVLACWSLLTLGLLAVGAPLNRATAVGSLVTINLLAYLSGSPWLGSPEGPDSTAPTGAGPASRVER